MSVSLQDRVVIVTGASRGIGKNRFTHAPDGEYGLNYLCAGYKAFFEHIDAPMRVMADHVARGLPADGIMKVLDAQEQNRFAGAGRNDPCPCGSGRKYKHCHAQT